MKMQLTYEGLKTMAFELSRLLPKDCQLVAISRGGLTFAHLVAYYKAMPLGFFIPASKKLVLAGEGPVVFLEDLIAKGRTLSLVEEVMRPLVSTWSYVCVVQDARFEVPAHLKHKVTAMMKSEDWIVFPHEDFNSVVEKDWGLFREGTSENSKPLDGKGFTTGEAMEHISNLTL